MKKNRAAKYMNNGFYEGAPYQHLFEKAVKRYFRAIRRRIKRGSHVNLGDKNE